MQALGAKVVNRHGGEVISGPRIYHPAVLAQIDARIVADKCVTVSDHVLVVARVLTARKTWDKSGAHTFEPKEWHTRAGAGMLAYSMQGYKALGTTIEITESRVVEDVVPQRDVATVNDSATQTHSISARQHELTETIESPLEHVDEQISESADPFIGAEESMDQDVDRSYTYNDGLEQSKEPTGTENVQETQQNASDTENVHHDLQVGAQTEKSNSSSIGASPASTQRRERTTQHAAGGAWGIASSTRQFSSLARPQPSNQRRQYSAPSDSSPTKSSPQDQVTDPALLSTTIKDYLGLQDEFYHPPRTRHLQRAKLAAAQARNHLDLHSADMTAEQRARTWSEIHRARTLVSKTLALHAAADLRRMLDEGQVDWRVVPWMEGTIERGLVVIAREVRQTEAALKSGKIGNEIYGRAMERLGAEDRALSTEANRLREMTRDDEDDYGVSGP